MRHSEPPVIASDGRRRRGRPQLGKGPEVDRGRLVAMLLKVAAEEGTAALNMRRIAMRLGVSPKLLYRFVRDKDEMLELLGDAILAENPIDLSQGNWEARLRAIASSGFEAFRQYPGLPAALLSHALRRSELSHAKAFRAAIFDALEDSGLPRGQVEEAFILFCLLSLGGMVMMEDMSGQNSEFLFNAQKVQSSLDMGIELLIFGIKRSIQPEQDELQ